MWFTAADVFNAIIGYYVLVLAGSAVVGATRALRDPDPGALATASVDPGSGSASAGLPGGPATSGRAGAVTGLTHSRALRAFHRFGWATGVGAAVGWLAGRDMYRWATPRVADLARKGRERWSRRGERPDGETEAAPQPAPIPGGGPDPAATAPGRKTAPAPVPPAPPAPFVTALGGSAPPAVGPDPLWLDDDPGDGYTPPAARPAATATRPAALPSALPGPEDPRRPGRPLLVLVPEPQEYPSIMPASEITDYESLIHFTDQTAETAGMEAEDAAAASASMIAGAEFAQQTANRVADETTALEAAVAAMAALRVDADSRAAYTALLEAGHVYREQTTLFAQQCHEAAGTAGTMAQAGVTYHETAQAALAVLNAHQGAHAEAAAATGHGGADGQFYGVANTGPSALAGNTAGALPVGS